MIEKILDNYYTKKFIKVLTEIVLKRYNLDYRFIKDKDKVYLEIKNKKYKDYTQISTIYKDASLYYMSTLEAQLNDTIKSIEKYGKDF